MKVLKKGNVPSLSSYEKWSTAVTCKKEDKYDKKGCGAVLKIKIRDLVLMYYKGAWINHFYMAVQCPVCGKYTSVPVPVAHYERFATAERRSNAIFDGFSDRD